MNDTPVACQTRGPTDPQGDRCPHIPAASAATYPLRCFAPQWARFDNRQNRPAHPVLLSHCVSGSGASALSVSDGDSFAPRRELLLSAVTKVAKSTGRNCVSALPQRATVGCDFPHLLAGITFHHRCRAKGLCLRSPARRLTRPLASATAGVFRSYRRTPISLPLEGSVLLSGAPPKAFPLGGSRY